MLFYRASLPLSRRTLTYATGVIRRHRKTIGSKGRALPPGTQALMTLVYLCKGETFAELAAGFAVSTSTAWRYVNEAVDALAARSPKLDSVLRRARTDRLPHLILDGTLVTIDRLAADRPFYSGKHRRHGMNLQVLAADRPFYSGKHRRHGMNLQVLAAPDGALLWVSGELRGAVHDLTAARIWGLIRAPAAAGLLVLADKAYQGAGEHIVTPYKGRGKPESQKEANRAHARLRGPGERANAQLKTWKVLRRLRCCPFRTGRIAKAIHTLQLREAASC
ncbi:transposase family protein [Actinomadura viridis]|uniref:transposase family protein n=1 Tax=Actinomadura viridis TaxID=58110 RepID=UPI0036BF59E3